MRRVDVRRPGQLVEQADAADNETTKTADQASELRNEPPWGVEPQNYV